MCVNCGSFEDSQKLNINTYFVSFNLKDFILCMKLHTFSVVFFLSIIRIEKKNNTQLYTHFGCEDNIDDGARRICDKIIGGKELSTESFLLLSFRQCMRKNFEKPNQREMNE